MPPTEYEALMIILLVLVWDWNGGLSYIPSKLKYCTTQKWWYIQWKGVATLKEVLQIYHCLYSTLSIRQLGCKRWWSIYHCKKERVVMTNFAHLSCTQYCCKPWVRYTKNVPHTNLITHLERIHQFIKLFMIWNVEYIAVANSECLMMLKWNHATDITNMGQINCNFLQWYIYTYILYDPKHQ